MSARKRIILPDEDVAATSRPLFSFDELVNIFIEAKKSEKCAARTIKTYKDCCRYLKTWLDEELPCISINEGKQIGKTLVKNPSSLIYFLVFLIAIDFIADYKVLILLIPAGILIYFIYKINQNRRILISGIKEIDEMQGLEFENYLAVLFEKLGYKVRKTPYNDFGVDLVIKDQQGIKTAIQAKRYNSNVGVKAIQEAVAGKNHYSCLRSMVITNHDFTNQAKRLAQTNNVFLWNRERLIEAILKAQDSKNWLQSMFFNFQRVRE